MNIWKHHIFNVTLYTNIENVNRMTKQIFEKILSGGVLLPNDLTADEKKVLNAVMAKYGMPQSTSYVRFFDKGFSQWEILGVSTLCKEFLLTSVCTSDGETEEEGSRGYGLVISMSSDYDDSQFYDIVTRMKMGKMLCQFMADRGMASQTTVRNRFKDNDWKPWELKGVKAIIDELFEDDDPSATTEKA